MKEILEFFSFSDPNIRYVVLGSMLLAASSAIVGVFIVLKKKALIGDAVSHSVLPGVCAAFLFTGTKNIPLLIAGAFISGWLSIVLIDYITRNSKVKKDAAISIVLTVFFGLGVVMLTYIQHHGFSSQSGLEGFIFGNAAALIGSDVLVFSGIGLLLVLTVIAFFKEFALTAFDEPFAKTIGLPVGKLELLLTTLTVLAVVTGITAVGVVLMAAMLITPAAAARFWTDNLKKIVLISACFGAVSGLAGAFISYLAPSMPTGPWMVVSSSCIAFFSFFFAPKRGSVFRWWKKRQYSRKADEENILKAFFQLGERDAAVLADADDTLSSEYSSRQLNSRGMMNQSRFLSGLGRLKRKNRVDSNPDGRWRLTSSGKAESARIVRLHRLWELYLTKYMQMPAHKVHENAEMIEHVLNAQLEKELEQQLGFPEKDPHESHIPRLKEKSDD